MRACLNLYSMSGNSRVSYRNSEDCIRPTALMISSEDRLATACKTLCGTTLPTTAAHCRSRLSTGGRRSIREESKALSVEGTRRSEIGPPGTLDAQGLAFLSYRSSRV